ncbi:MAG TPA: hypothetical protein PLS62_11180 [Desulfobacteraceae bacterium]|nr:hypothetical protein [Desulfobacteraceae bacterium]
MKTTQRNFRFPDEVYEELQATAEKNNCSITDLIVEGAKKEIVWRKIRDELNQPQTLVFNEEKGYYEAEPEYREKFLKILETNLAIL